MITIVMMMVMLVVMVMMEVYDNHDLVPNNDGGYDRYEGYDGVVEVGVGSEWEWLSGLGWAQWYDAIWYGMRYAVI